METAVLNLVHFQTLLASKAARCVLAARGRPVVEFGLRRTHGIDAGMKAARCAFIAGAAMSSNVLAGLSYGIPPTGTMAHSYVSAFPARSTPSAPSPARFPAQTTLLLDTYDTLAAARKAVLVAKEMEARGQRLAGVRLDSGDLVEPEPARSDGSSTPPGSRYVQIFASGGLDERSIERMPRPPARPSTPSGWARAWTSPPISPYLDMAYKLVEYDGRPVLKSSAGKVNLGRPEAGVSAASQRRRVRGGRDRPARGAGASRHGRDPAALRDGARPPSRPPPGTHRRSGTTARPRSPPCRRISGELQRDARPIR